MNSKRSNKRGQQTVTWDTVRELALALPEVAESTSYGTPAFKVRSKLFIRLHELGDVIVAKIDQDERPMRIQADPNAFFLTDHYLDYPWILVRLSAVRREDLADIVVEAWRLAAPRKLVAEFDGE